MAYKPVVRVGPALSALAERCLRGPACDGAGGAASSTQAAEGEGWAVELEEARRWLERVAEIAGAARGGGGGNAAVVVSPGGRLLAEAEDQTRGPGGNPLRHAVREVLDAAAASTGAGDLGSATTAAAGACERGRKRRLPEGEDGGHAEGVARGGAGGGDLLTGSDLYVLREPCAMCAMALVHARVRRVFYCIRDSEHGMLGGHFPLQSLQGSHLNHYYEVFHWPLAD